MHEFTDVFRHNAVIIMHLYLQCGDIEVKIFDWFRTCKRQPYIPPWYVSYGEPMGHANWWPWLKLLSWCPLIHVKSLQLVWRSVNQSSNELRSSSGLLWLDLMISHQDIISNNFRHGKVSHCAYNEEKWLPYIESMHCIVFNVEIIAMSTVLLCTNVCLYHLCSLYYYWTCKLHLRIFICHNKKMLTILNFWLCL